MEKKQKLLSVKFWVTIWAMVLITFIILTDKKDFTTIAQLLCSVPLAYIGANVWQKKIIADQQQQLNEMEEDNIK